MSVVIFGNAVTGFSAVKSG